METVFFRCPICGNIMLKVGGSELIPQCCGQPMEKLEPGTTDGKIEYHVPDVKCCKSGEITVNIGQMPHPMTEQHHIQFIFLQTEHGGQIHYLKPNEEPKATFQTLDKPKVVYAYCNLHGLWKFTLESSCQKK